MTGNELHSARTRRPRGSRRPGRDLQLRDGRDQRRADGSAAGGEPDDPDRLVLHRHRSVRLGPPAEQPDRAADGRVWGSPGSWASSATPISPPPPRSGSPSTACRSAILIHLLIVFPSGRARGRLDRFFIGYAYVAGGLVAAIPIFFYNPAADPDCAGCVSSNPLLIHDNLDLVHAIFSTLSAVSIPVLIALDRPPGSPGSSARTRQSGGVRRRSGGRGRHHVPLRRRPAHQSRAREGNYDDVIWYLANLVIASVPFAFLLGLLRDAVVRRRT